MKRALALGLLCALASAAVGGNSPAAPAEPPKKEDPETVLRRVTAEALTIPKQAEALARVAWPADGSRQEPALAAAARERLVRFGHQGLSALRAALARVDPLYTADVTSALIAARWHVSAGEPPDFLPGLVDALWYGSPEAQRLAMLEVSLFGFSAAVTPIIDAVEATPALTPVATATLARMADERGRFFLQGVLNAGPDRWRPGAAEALATLDAAGFDLLREALASADAGVRRAAIRALLPRARSEDLTALYEYAERHGREDPEMVARIEARATEIEAAIEQAPVAPDPGEEL